eukprot:scaffold9308_cov115-Cylindrotheca_fusiformis.AAC.19
MNLASKYREAISHVAVLKRELGEQQQRAAQALALQRQQTQQLALKLSNKRDDERMLSSAPSDPSQSESAPKPPIPKPAIELVQPSTASTSPESKSSSSSESESHTEIQQTSINISSSTASSSSAMRDDSSYEPTPSPTVYYSTPKKRTGPIQISPSEDDAYSPTMNLFPLSASPNVRSESRNDYDDELPADIVDPNIANKSPGLHLTEQDIQSDDEQSSSSTTMAIMEEERGLVSTASIDEFEASFDATFPTNFSSQTDQDSGSDLEEESPYDPFAPSTESPDRPSSRQQGGSHLELSPADSHGSPDCQTVKNGPWNEDLALHNTESYSTPPKNGIGGATTDTGEDQPKRPEKTPSAEARAQYDRALQPRHSNPVAAPSPPAQSDQNHIKGVSLLAPSPSNEAASASPSPLLKRIQERRMKKEVSRQNSMPSPNVPKPGFLRHHSAPEPSNEGRPFTTHKPLASAEGRLNVPAPASTGGHHTKDSRTKTLRRRSVKQPISYSEPPLNTKLRQGHVFFQKEEDDSQ